MAAARLLQEKLCMSVLMSRFTRTCATSAPHRSVVQLSGRAVVRVHGEDSFKLLQGIVSNDLLLLQPGSSLYSMILNAKGRTVYDIIVYVRNQEAGTFIPEYLIESDALVAEELCTLLKRYRMRSKVHLELAEDWKVWSILPNGGIENIKVNKFDAILSADPRLAELGHRLLLPGNTDGTSVVPDSYRAEQSVYRKLRYKLGVCEGVEELPPGETTPLESNLAWLNGVSFSKGCYVGQELTSRTHHTGVVRKRVMPISIKHNGVAVLTLGTTLADQNGQPVGKVRAWDGRHGLALLRLAKVADGTLKAKLSDKEEINITARRPQWWPSDTSEEA